MSRWPLRKAYFWESAPFFRLLLPLVAGIFCYDRFGSQTPSLSLLIGIIIVSIILYVPSALKKDNRLLAVCSFLLLHVLMFTAGYSLSYGYDSRNDKLWFGAGINNRSVHIARITSTPTEKDKTWKIPVQITGAVTDSKITKVTGAAFVYIYKDIMPMLYQKGDTLLLPANWQPIKNAGNPYEFDHATYCQRNNIHYQQFCSGKEVRLLATNDPAAAHFTEQVHTWCMAQLDEYVPDTTTRGLIQAMLLGDEVNLDAELRQSFSETGIVHVIAISGGNVMIFFTFIGWLLWWIKNKKYTWIQYLLALPLIWFYVLMAGASPSAIRAAIMFSVLAFGILFQKNRNSLNQLLATAFVLLCAQPMWLYSLGFQLSFVAVLSLILFYTPIYKVNVPANKWLRKIWSVICASIAAEILVAPLVVYYFHNFPLMFIVANVLAFLLMEAVLLLGVLIITLSFMPVVAKSIGIITTWLVCSFDLIVDLLKAANPVSFSFLHLSGAELLVVYITITGIAIFLLHKQKRSLFVGMCACCVLLLLFCNDKWHSLKQERLVVYNTGGANHIEHIIGDRFMVLHTDTSAIKKIDYAVKASHIHWQSWKETKTTVNEIMNIDGKTILVLNEPIVTGSKFHVDNLVINYNGKPDVKNIAEIYSPDQIIVGNNLNRKQQVEWVQAGRVNGINVHAVGTDGAFVTGN